jgi:hypothetical protein
MWKLRIDCFLFRYNYLLSEFYDKYGDGDSRKPLVAENAAAIQLQYQ